MKLSCRVTHPLPWKNLRVIHRHQHPTVLFTFFYYRGGKISSSIKVRGVSHCVVTFERFLLSWLISSLYRADPNQATCRPWSLKWWRLPTSMSNAWDTSARGKRASHGAYRLWSMRSTVEKEQLAPRPDVSRWSVSLSIRERAKERRQTSVAAPSAPNWCPCAFIIRSSAANLCVVFRSVGSWSESCKLLSSIKLNSRAFKGEISLAQSLTDCLRFSVLVWSPFLNSWFRQSPPRQRRLRLLAAKARLRRWNPHQRD